MDRQADRGEQEGKLGKEDNTDKLFFFFVCCPTMWGNVACSYRCREGRRTKGRVTPKAALRERVRGWWTELLSAPLSKSPHKRTHTHSPFAVAGSGFQNRRADARPGQWFQAACGQTPVQLTLQWRTVTAYVCFGRRRMWPPKHIYPKTNWEIPLLTVWNNLSLMNAGWWRYWWGWLDVRRSND